jgi:hypothetical protein
MYTKENGKLSKTLVQKYCWKKELKKNIGKPLLDY